jgi:plastocyanin
MFARRRIALFVTIAALLPLASERSASSTSLGSASGIVTVERDGKRVDASRVVIHLEGVTKTGSIPGATLHQNDLTFSPDLVVVAKGATVEFPNDDKVFHNVFSLSQAAKFDLGLYKSGTSKSVTFRKAGVIDVFCNIHPNMMAKIKVVDSGYFAVTGGDGRFDIRGVPPGHYTAHAWHRTGDEAHVEVDIVADGTAKLSFKLTERAVVRQHSRKDGTPYGRYQ